MGESITSSVKVMIFDSKLSGKTKKLQFIIHCIATISISQLLIIIIIIFIIIKSKGMTKSNA